MSTDIQPTSFLEIKRLAEDIHGRLNTLSSTDTHSPDGSSALGSDTLESIDDTLARSLSQVRMLRNAQAPINTLPREILIVVFEMLAGPRMLSNSSPRDPPMNPLNWMPVTHVCRYWRETALGYPFIWTPIVFAYPDIDNASSLPYEWLQRSEGAPLDVQVKWDGATHFHAVWEKLATRCKRLRKLHIEDLMDTESLRGFNDEAPLLESLSIKLSHKFVLERQMTRSAEHDVFSDELPLLFAGHTPSLRYLTLAFFTRFGGNHFANLTHLHLYDQDYDTPADLSRLLSMLEASPGLEEFVIQGCNLMSPNNDHTIDPMEHFVSMPSLRRLSFERCHATVISIILFRLELSSHGVSITCSDWWPSERHIATIFPAKMRSRIYPLHDVTKLGLAYDTSEIRAVSPTSATHIRFENDLDAIDSIAPGLRLVLSFHALQELWLSGIELHAWEFWQDAFGAMPALAKLVLGLTPTSPEKWLRALTSEGLGGRPYPAPVLQGLWIFPPFPDVSEIFASMLRVRDHDGHRIHQLHVMCKTLSRSEEIRREFETWRDQRGYLEEFVDEVYFESVHEYPQIDVPEACRSFIP